MFEYSNENKKDDFMYFLVNGGKGGGSYWAFKVNKEHFLLDIPSQ